MAKKKEQSAQDIREQLASSESKDILKEENLDLEVKKAIKPAPEIPQTSDKAISKLQVDVEKLVAEVEVFKQFRNMNEEKFHHLTEEIGELRSTLLEKEKKIGEFEAKTAKVYDMVEAVQPDQLMKSVQTLEARLETTAAGMSKSEKVTDSLMAELRDIRDAVAVFKNTERLVKLNAEIGHRLGNIDKVQSKIDRQSNKVEDMFIEMGKKTAKYDVLFDKVDSLDAAFKDMLKGFDEVEIGYKDLIQKKDLEKFQKEVSRTIDEEKKDFLKLKEDAQLKLGNASQFLSALEEKEESFDKQSYLLLNDARAVLKKASEKQATYDSILSKVAEFEKTLQSLDAVVRGSESASAGDLNTLRSKVDSVDKALKEEIAGSIQKVASEVGEKVSGLQSRLDDENTDIRTQLTQHLEDIKSIREEMREIEAQRALLKELGTKLIEANSQISALDTGVAGIMSMVSVIPEYKKLIDRLAAELDTQKVKLKSIGEMKKAIDQQKEAGRKLQLDVVSRVENCELGIAGIQKIVPQIEAQKKDMAAIQKGLATRIDAVDNQILEQDSLIQKFEDIRKTIKDYEKKLSDAGTTIKKMGDIENTLQAQDERAKMLISEVQDLVGQHTQKLEKLSELTPRIDEHDSRVAGLESIQSKIQSHDTDILNRLQAYGDQLTRLDTLEKRVAGSEKELLVFIKDSKTTLIQMEKKKDELDSVVESILGSKDVIEDFHQAESSLKQRVSDIERKATEVIGNLSKANRNLHEKEAKWSAVLEENENLIEMLEKDRGKVVGDIVRESTQVTRTLMSEVEAKHKEFLGTIAEVNQKIEQLSREREDRLLTALNAAAEASAEELNTIAEKHTEEQTNVLERTHRMVTSIVDAEKVLKGKREELKNQLDKEAKKYSRLESSVNNLLTIVNNLVSYPNLTNLPIRQCEGCGRESKVFWVCSKCGKKICEDCAKTYSGEIYCNGCLHEAARIVKYKQQAAATKADAGQD